MISSKISEELLCQQTEEDLIDLLSRAFEGDWKLGRNPTIQQFLDKYAQSLPETSRLELKRQLQSVLSECQSTFPRPRDTSSTIVGSTLSQERPPLFQFDLPHQFGEYELTSIVGTGGKSVVYLGTRDKSGDAFAIKITPSSFITDRRGFERELNVVSQLEHPRIIKPLISGTVREYSYVTSKYLSAPNLRDYLEANGPFTISQAVEIVASLADTLQYAHERGIIHRDLKPRNVLLVDNQSAEANHTDGSQTFVPIIIDFGLAKDVNSESSATLTGTFFGTPAYTSPEQAKFDTRKTSSRSDIYSLGVILYELIGYSTPFQGSVESLLNQIASNEVPSVKKRNRLIDSTLANICHKCLRLEPQRRYETAGDLATDLRHWLASERVKTKAYTYSELFKLGFKKASRHRGWLATAAILLLAVNVLVVSSVTTGPKTEEVYKDVEEFSNRLRETDWRGLQSFISGSRSSISKYREELRNSTNTGSELFIVKSTTAGLSDEGETQALANKIGVLVDTKEYELLWKHLKPSPDPRVQYYLIKLLPHVIADPTILSQWLVDQEDNDVRFSVLLALTGYSPEQIDSVRKKSLEGWVIDAYENNPHPGVHAVCRRMLQRWNNPTIDQIDNRLKRRPISWDFDWYVTPSGIHMAIVRARLTFWMGKWGGINPQNYFENGRQKTIEQSYAIAMEPAPVELYQLFMAESGIKETLVSQDVVCHRNWIEYAKFCVWLSRRDQLIPADTDSSDFETIALSTTKWSAHYRMPSISEWENFARAGAVTDYHFGTASTFNTIMAGSNFFAYLINANGHCFATLPESTSSRSNPNHDDLDIVDIITSAFLKGGERSPGFLRELSAAGLVPLKQPHYAMPEDFTFRIAQSLPSPE